MITRLAHQADMQAGICFSRSQTKAASGCRCTLTLLLLSVACDDQLAAPPAAVYDLRSK